MVRSMMAPFRACSCSPIPVDTLTVIGQQALSETGPPSPAAQSQPYPTPYHHPSPAGKEGIGPDRLVDEDTLVHLESAMHVYHHMKQEWHGQTLG
jgi:hypothetical protein